MNCIQCKEYLLEYAEGTLSASLQEQVQKHIDTCPKCAEEAALFAQMTDVLHHMPEVDLPEGYHTELMQKIQKESKTVLPFPAAKRRNWKNIGLIAAAVLVVVAAGGVQGIQKLRTAQESIVAEATQQENVSEDMTQEQAVTSPQMENSTVQTPISENTQASEQNIDTTTNDIATPKASAQQSNDTVSVPSADQAMQSNTAKQETTSQEQSQEQPQESSSQPPVMMMEESQAVQPQTEQEATQVEPQSASGAGTTQADIAMVRASQEPYYQATLTVTDVTESMQTVRETMVDFGATEQSSTESSITFSVAIEKKTEVFEALKQIGTLQEPEITQTQQDTITLTISLQQE